jgi:chaperone required for assembly of F1-ATPase
MAAIISLEDGAEDGGAADKGALSLRGDVSLAHSTAGSGFSVAPAEHRTPGTAALSQRPHPIEKPRRFYKLVDTAPVETGFSVRLDGRTPASPAKAKLVLPTAALAQLVAAEWDAQREVIDTSAMPATRLAWTAIDRIAQTREATAAEVASFAGTDLVCYFADSPTPLVERQARHWGGVLDWARDHLDLHFQPVTGIVHASQPVETLEKVERLALSADDFTLAGLAYATGLFGSAVLALAVKEGRLTGQEALDLSRLDEIFQAELWGQDAEAIERAAGMAVEATMLERWFAALRA